MSKVESWSRGASSETGHDMGRSPEAHSHRPRPAHPCLLPQRPRTATGDQNYLRRRRRLLAGPRPVEDFEEARSPAARPTPRASAASPTVLGWLPLPSRRVVGEGLLQWRGPDAMVLVLSTTAPGVPEPGGHSTTHLGGRGNSGSLCSRAIRLCSI
jgi:hypothetical protein